jgi:hypothetical protein
MRQEQPLGTSSKLHPPLVLAILTVPAEPRRLVVAFDLKDLSDLFRAACRTCQLHACTSSLGRRVVLAGRHRYRFRIGDTSRRRPPLANGGRFMVTLSGSKGDGLYFLVSQKILSISAIWASSSSATATSLVFLASPAFFVAFQNKSWSCGYFSRCSGLK